METVVVLGALVQVEADKYHLEDPSGRIELDISEAQFSKGLFTEGSIILAQG